MEEPRARTTQVGDAAIGAVPGSLPQCFIDAGDVPWLELEGLLRQQMSELRPGEALELQSGDPATIMTLPGWCAGEGHTLIHAQPGDGHVFFWIGKQ